MYKKQSRFFFKASRLIKKMYVHTCNKYSFCFTGKKRWWFQRLLDRRRKLFQQREFKVSTHKKWTFLAQVVCDDADDDYWLLPVSGTHFYFPLTCCTIFNNPYQAIFGLGSDPLGQEYLCLTKKRKMSATERNTTGCTPNQWEGWVLP